MKFCTVCENMYYIRINEDDFNKLVYYCRHCGNEEESNNLHEDIIVSQIILDKKNTSYRNTINKYTKLDPTLPRINNILCPNKDCCTNVKDNEEKEVIYFRYNETDMKYLYLCCKCDTVWEINNK